MWPFGSHVVVLLFLKLNVTQVLKWDIWTPFQPATWCYRTPSAHLFSTATGYSPWIWYQVFKHSPEFLILQANSPHFAADIEVNDIMNLIHCSLFNHDLSTPKSTKFYTYLIDLMDNEHVHYTVHKINFNSIDSMHRPAKWSPPDVLRTKFHNLNTYVIRFPVNLIALVLIMSDEKYKRLRLRVEFYPAVTSPYSGPYRYASLNDMDTLWEICS
jgi:hypothetical protein